MNRQYPRPQLYRENIMLLDGKWLLDGDEINVPYPPQSKLSGYSKEVSDRFTYSKAFRVDELSFDENSRFILHFGAVDQIAKVYVNGVLLGEHRGGYLSFQFDITNVNIIKKRVLEEKQKFVKRFVSAASCLVQQTVLHRPRSG